MYGLAQKMGNIVEILKSKNCIQIVKIKLDNGTARAFNYINITGKVKIGDRVLVNTTGIELSLGTGGYHFVICNFDKKNTYKDNGKKSSFFINSLPTDYGHMMKLRYTPFQIITQSIEEKDSPYHELFKKNLNLEKCPVVILPLHSLLLPLGMAFKYFFPDKTITYIMSEGGSLALEFSLLVQKLIEKEILDHTITAGHAYGGELEAVNIFTGLLAAKKVLKSDLIVVGMGPGIAGTATPLGYSGVENAFINHAVGVLNGRSIIVPRISLADRRNRHFILSHHTITLLERLVQNWVEVIFPDNNKIKERLNQTEIYQKHVIYFYKYKKLKKILYNSNFNFNSMGRNLKDDPLFFITGALPVLWYKEIIEGA